MLVCKKKLLCYVRAFWLLFVLVFPFLCVSYINIYSYVSLGDVSYVMLTLAVFFFAGLILSGSCLVATFSILDVMAIFTISSFD